MNGVRIAGMGIALPPDIVSNDDLARELLAQRESVIAQGITLTDAEREEYETSDAWIQKRTGVRERRRSRPDETTSDYALRSSQEAWTDAYGDGLEAPDFLLSASVIPDHFTTPPMDVVIHRKMSIPVRTCGETSDLRHFIGADIAQACTSFMEALYIGYVLIKSGEAERGIVNGADLMFRTLSRNKRSPLVLLGEGSGAVVLEATTAEQSWFGPRAFLSGVNGGHNGEYENLIKTLAGGAAVPLKPEHLDPRRDDNLMFMNGNAVFKKVVPLVADHVIPAALKRAGLTPYDIDVLVLHQANYCITEAIVEYLMKQYKDLAIAIATWDNPVGSVVKVKSESGVRTGYHTIICYSNIERFANMTSASVPVAMHEARELGIIQPGKRVLSLAFGGGFSWCSAIIHWGGLNHHAFQKAA